MTDRNPTPVRRPAFLGGLAALAASAATVLLLAAGANAEPSVTAKRAEANRVLAQIRDIDVEVGLAAEAYNLATIKLEEIRAAQKKNAQLLRVSKRNLGQAQRLLEERLVAIYTSGEATTTLDVVLGATSVEDLLNRLEAVERVSSQDAEVLRQVRAMRGAVQKQKGRLAQARSRQERIVAERAARQRAIEAKLAQRQQLLASIRSEIDEIERRERARQLTLVRQARQRLAAQRRDTAEEAVAAEAQQAAVEEPAAGTAPPAKYGGVVGIAMQYLGVPYKWGGASPSTGFDCSGFTMYVYAQVGVSLPHNAAMQFNVGVPVSRSELQPGDLVFFHGLGHMGMYIGGGQFIHAPQTGDVVKISSLNGWYASRYVGARRVTG